MSDVNDGTTATRTIASQTEPVHSETRDTVAQSSAPTPQMQHLAKAFEGTWKTHESFAKNEFYPNGAERSGTARFALATGGTALIENVRSDGSAGKLEFMVVLWWDGTENVYKMFTCGNGGLSPCRMRGVAHWEGDKFVNEYELTIRGANHKAKDSFEQISSKSFTLVASADLFGTGMAPIITTTYTK
jgi:hypothetical protein